MKIQSKLGKLKYFFALGAFSTVFTTGSIIPAFAQNRNSQQGITCGSHAGVWVCNRKTDFGVGNHGYLWDARTGKACGTGDLGLGRTNKPELGPRGDSCNFVPSSEGKEKKILNHCRNNANNGVWVPGINDCHNAAQESVEESDLKYPGAPGGRFGKRNYSNSDSPAWVESVESEYSRDSNGDGILNQSYDPFAF